MIGGKVLLEFSNGKSFGPNHPFALAICSLRLSIQSWRSPSSVVKRSRTNRTISSSFSLEKLKDLVAFLRVYGVGACGASGICSAAICSGTGFSRGRTPSGMDCLLMLIPLLHVFLSIRCRWSSQDIHASLQRAVGWIVVHHISKQSRKIRVFI